MVSGEIAPEVEQDLPAKLFKIQKECARGVLKTAILAHFQLTLQAECNLLQSDLAWWEHKFVYRPQLLEDQSVKDVIEGLKTRLDSMRSLGLGKISEEFRLLAPYQHGTDMEIIS